MNRTLRLNVIVAAALAASLAACSGSDSGSGNPLFAPTITSIAGATVDEDTVVGPLTFAIGDANTHSTSLTVAANSGNEDVCPQSRIALGGTGGSRNITVTPADDAVGSCTIVVTVTNAIGLRGTATFTLNFREVRVNFTTFARQQYGQPAEDTPAETNRVKFDFPDNDDNDFMVFSDLLPTG